MHFAIGSVRIGLREFNRIRYSTNKLKMGTYTVRRCHTAYYRIYNCGVADPRPFRVDPRHFSVDIPLTNGSGSGYQEAQKVKNT
jgi:hypothetical protein